MAKSCNTTKKNCMMNKITESKARMKWITALWAETADNIATNSRIMMRA